jgi:hypothetical protein
VLVRRIVLLVVVALVMAAMMAASALPVLGRKRPRRLFTSRLFGYNVAVGFAHSSRR